MPQLQFVPEGLLKIAQCFNTGLAESERRVPEGRLNAGWSNESVVPPGLVLWFVPTQLETLYLFSAARGHLGRSRFDSSQRVGLPPELMASRCRCGLEGRAPLDKYETLGHYPLSLRDNDNTFRWKSPHRRSLSSKFCALSKRHSGRIPLRPTPDRELDIAPRKRTMETRGRRFSRRPGPVVHPTSSTRSSTKSAPDSPRRPFDTPSQPGQSRTMRSVRSIPAAPRA